MAGKNLTVKLDGFDKVKAALARMDPAQNVRIMRSSLLDIAFSIQDIAARVMIVPGGEDRRDKSPLGRRLTSRTGTLRRSIKVDRTDLPGAVEVGTDLVYGAVHEFGGTVRVKSHWRRRTTKRSGLRGVALTAGGPIFVKPHSATYPPRPFMQPALERVRPKMANIVLEHWAREAGLV